MPRIIRILHSKCILWTNLRKKKRLISKISLQEIFLSQLVLAYLQSEILLEEGGGGGGGGLGDLKKICPSKKQKYPRLDLTLSHLERLSLERDGQREMAQATATLTATASYAYVSKE